MSRDLNSALLKLLSAKSVEAAWAILTVELDRFGFDRLIYGMTRFRTEASLGHPKDMLILSNHSDDYVHTFINKRMFQHAPMAVWAMKNVGAQSWSWISECGESLSAEQVKVLELNKKHGVLAGYTISFPDPSPRQKAAIGLAARSGLTQCDVEQIWAKHGEEIEILAQVAHLKFASLPAPVAQQQLSKRQRESLEWVSEGKTTQDIAILLDLTPATIEKHLRLAREALDVETTAQAVLKAAFYNQMFVLDT